MPRQVTVTQRFIEKITITDSCWEWKGSLFKGYGSFYYQGKKIKAHRFSYMYFNKLPYLPEPHLHVHHTCYNKSCVNPNHLKLLSAEEHGKIEGKFNAVRVICMRGLHVMANNRQQSHPKQCWECRLARAVERRKERLGTPEYEAYLVRRREADRVYQKRKYWENNEIVTSIIK